MRPITLALAFSLSGSMAAAQPWSRPHAEPIYDRSPSGKRWQELLVRPTERPDIDVIIFRGKGGRLDWLRIVPMRGIRSVEIAYEDRPPQIIWRDRMYRQGDQIIPIDRRFRIREIVIHHHPRATGYAVFAG